MSILLSEGFKRSASKNSANPSYEEEPEEQKQPVKPSGGGAFAGMVVGGALGLPFGILIRRAHRCGNWNTKVSSEGEKKDAKFW